MNIEVQMIEKDLNNNMHVGNRVRFEIL